MNNGPHGIRNQGTIVRQGRCVEKGFVMNDSAASCTVRDAKGTYRWRHF